MKNHFLKNQGKSMHWIKELRKNKGILNILIKNRQTDEQTDKHVDCWRQTGATSPQTNQGIKPYYIFIDFWKLNLQK